MSGRVRAALEGRVHSLVVMHAVALPAMVPCGPVALERLRFRGTELAEVLFALVLFAPVLLALVLYRLSVLAPGLYRLAFSLREARAAPRREGGRLPPGSGSV